MHYAHTFNRCYIVVSFSLCWLSVYSLNNVFKSPVHCVEMFHILFCYFQLDGFVQPYTTALLLCSLCLSFFRTKLSICSWFTLYLLLLVSTSHINFFFFTQKINSVSMHNSSVLEFDAVKQPSPVRPLNSTYTVFNFFIFQVSVSILTQNVTILNVTL